MKLEPFDAMELEILQRLYDDLPRLAAIDHKPPRGVNANQHRVACLIRAWTSLGVDQLAMTFQGGRGIVYRALEQLHERGLIVRDGQTRTTHARLTPAGVVTCFDLFNAERGDR